MKKFGRVEMEELRDRKFHLREKFETLKQMEELEEPREEQMKKRGELKELSQREFDLRIEVEELKGMEELKKMRDLCKVGDLFKYYLLRGKTPFHMLEEEYFYVIKGYYCRPNLFKV